MRFVKLELTWHASPWLLVLSAAARLSWIMLLTYAKANGSKGRVKRLDPETAARLWFLGSEDVRQMEAAAIKDGALTVDGGDWLVANWARYQGDETNAERQRRHRERKQVTESNESNALQQSRNANNTEEKRREEKRVEEKLLSPSPPRGKSENGVDLFALMNWERTGRVAEMWAAYCQHRKEKRLQQYTQTGLTRLCTHLRSHGITPDEFAGLLDKAMFGNWAGIPYDTIVAIAQHRVPSKPKVSAGDARLSQVAR